MRKSVLRLAVAGVAMAGAVATLPATAAPASSQGHHEGSARPAAAAKPMPNEWTVRQAAGDEAPGGTRVTSVAPAGHHESNDTKAATVHGCEYYQFCTYANANYTKMVDRMSSCTWHKVHDVFNSYVNNQTRGTQATFYTFVRPPQILGTSKPAPSQTATDFGYAGYIIPC